MSDIERLRYYEREYLRSFDFEAEQRYHMEMRRRLNLALHLWGIVDGLELHEDTSTPGVINSVSVTAGMAIDAYGREIVLFRSHILSEDDIVRITVPGEYSVWAAYSLAPSRPPAATHRISNLQNQFTRWTESTKIIVANGIGRNPLEAPDAADALSDDPQKRPWPVLLGSVYVGQEAGTNRMFFSGVLTKKDQRQYIASNAQRLVAPSARLNDIDTPTDASLPISAESDLQATKNLIVGQDFAITGTIKSPPTDRTRFPEPTGNLRLERELFLQGDLYKRVGLEWLSLKEYLKTLTPEIQTGVAVLTPPAPTTDPDPPIDPSTGTQKVTRKSQLLTNPSTASVTVALSGIEWKSKTDHAVWYLALTEGLESKPIEIKVAWENLQSIGANQFSFDIRWTVLPEIKQLIQVKSLTVSYIVVFQP